MSYFVNSVSFINSNNYKNLINIFSKPPEVGWSTLYINRIFGLEELHVLQMQGQQNNFKRKLEVKIYFLSYSFGLWLGYPKAHKILDLNKALFVWKANKHSFPFLSFIFLFCIHIKGIVITTSKLMGKLIVGIKDQL